MGFQRGTVPLAGIQRAAPLGVSPSLSSYPSIHLHTHALMIPPAIHASSAAGTA